MARPGSQPLTQKSRLKQARKRRRAEAARTEGQSPEGKSPERKCIASGAVQPKDQMIRFVVGPDDEIVPDLGEKLPGRGIWVSADKAALGAAIEKRLFSRAARAKVNVSADLEALVTKLLASRCVSHIGLAQKAGAAVAGFDKVEAWVRNRPTLVLLEAADGAQDGRQKLVRLVLKRAADETGTIQVVGLLDSAELSLAFGRQHVIHAALSAAPVVKMAMRDFERLAGFRPMVPPSWD